jgi:acetyltransferase-like isoleucine patch superfamily enzyme
MTTGIKAKIRDLIINKLVNMVSEIKRKYIQKEIMKLCENFSSVGLNFSISYPYLFSGEKYINIGDNFFAREHLRLQAIKISENQFFEPKITIGNNVSLEFNCHIGAIYEIEIQDDVLIASNVYISDHFHGKNDFTDLNVPPLKRTISHKGKMTIGKNVWIGDSVCILPGVSIGENSIIGANSVVTKSFPSNVIIAGVPAKIIKTINE